MATDTRLLDALYPLPPEELFRQWVLSQNPAAMPSSWDVRTLHGWRLAAHPDAHVVDLRAGDGSHIGWVVEPLVHLTGQGDQMLQGPPTISAARDDMSPGVVEEALYGRDAQGFGSGHGIEGMWTAIVLTGAEHSSLRRVYVGAIHTIVYSAMHRTVATSHNLMPTLRRHDVISRAFDPLEHNAPFTLGLTAFEGLSRLLPNHYLDLDSFAPVRHWPRLAMPPLDRAEDGAARVVEHSRRMVRVVGERHGTVRIFLSAGRDSRAVLALARPLLAEGVTISLATSVKPDFNALIDWHAARRLARIAKLPLEVRWRRRHVNDATAVMREFVRLGESKSGPILSSPDLRKRQPTTRGYTLSGMAGETARAVFWKRDAPNGELSPELLVKWIGSPSVSPVVEAAARWLDALPREMRGNSIDVLDLAYVENRLACLESTTRYLFPGRPQVMSPMAAAFNIETMLRLPGPYRQAGQLQRDMVARGWPELLAVPFNTPFGVLRAVRTAERAVHATRGRLGAMRRRWP